jgi:signal transduction histidine kinase
MEIIVQHLRSFGDKLLAFRFRIPSFLYRENIQGILWRIRSVGLNADMEEYEQRKLGIFNLLNFFQLLTGLLIPVLGALTTPQLPGSTWFLACLPAGISLLVLFLNQQRRFDAAHYAYFIGYPFMTCVVYMSGLNPGTSLTFILYGILSVFFLRDIGNIVFSLCFSMVSYFLLSVVLKHHRYDLEVYNNGLYLFNHGIALAFIFYGLFLVKQENAGYQRKLLIKNRVLEEKKEQIQKQANALRENASLLKNQAAELTELNTLKNKLFSIISHDLKAPMYALRNLFREVYQSKMSANELKKTVPDILNDLNYTVGLMDNLLQWAKAQMQTQAVVPQAVDVKKSIDEVKQTLHLQAKAKQITIVEDCAEGNYALMDKDMLSLVLRNLLSNAIKFTPVKGQISVGVIEHEAFLEVYVKDSGEGISEEALKKINKNDFYTTKGTASESGTGLGLMLCKEFLARNGGQLHIESMPGLGSVFSFTIPKSGEND